MSESPKDRNAWLQAVWSGTGTNRIPSFFSAPLVAGRIDVPCSRVACGRMARGSGFQTIRFSLAAFLRLPGDAPVEELGRLRGFFEWAADVAAATGLDQRDAPQLQWFRCGRERGLEWAGWPDDAHRSEREHSLQAWREQTWFARWHDDTLAAFRRRRSPPHTWYRMDGFEGAEAWAHRQARLGAPRTPTV